MAPAPATAPPRPHAVAPGPAAPPRRPAAPAPAAAPDGRAARRADPRGAAAVIATNMVKSLEVPTATSFRDVPARLLEVNRSVINGYLGRNGGGKVSFTHLIGFAVVKAIADDDPGDEQRRSSRGPTASPGSCTTSTSSSAWPSTSRRPTAPHAARARASATPTRSTSPASWPPTRTSSARSAATSWRRRLPGRHVRLTNPGTIGTVQSRAPADARPGRHRRRRLASTTRPSSRAPTSARSPRSACRRSSRSPHLRPPHHPGRRVGPVPQAGARAAARRGRLLRGRLPLARRALRGRPVARDVNPVDQRRRHAAQADAGRHAHPRPSRARPPHRRPRPAALEGAAACTAELDPRDLRADHLGPRPRVPHRLASAATRRWRSASCSACCATRTAARSASSTCTSRRPPSSAGSSARSRASTSRSTTTSSATSSGGSTRPRRSRSSSPPSTSGRSGSASKAPSRPSRSSTRCCGSAADAGLDSAVMGMAHRGRLNVLANIVGKSLRADLQGVRGQRRPDVHPGFGRREVPPRRRRASS